MQHLTTPATPSAIRDHRKSGPPSTAVFGGSSPFPDSEERRRATLEKVRAMRDALESGQTQLPATLEPNGVLFELGCELSAHFAEEENAAHLATLTRVRPGLLPRLVDLKADHGALLQGLARVQMIAQSPERWPEIPTLVSKLLVELAEHEQAEAALLAAYTAEGGSKR